MSSVTNKQRYSSRSQAIGITQAAFLGGAAVCIKFFPAMKNAMDIYGVCFLHAGIAMFNCILGAFTIPDNRGKSLVKVEENYEKKRGFDNSIEVTDL